MPTMTVAEAAAAAVRQEMARDPRVWILGEDVARGGLFGQYRGLPEQFGPLRVVSTPISESTILGAGLGGALVGTRPIVEMRVIDFAMCAMDELVNQIAKIRYMFGGQARPALVVRMPMGIWRNSAAQHSQMLEAWFAHLPGTVVCAPATPADEAGLLVAAIRSDDPVLFLDPKNLFTVTGEVAAEPIAPLPFGVARHVREAEPRRGRAGEAATIVSWSAFVPEAERAAATLAEGGVETDVLDLRTIWPWDEDAVCDSVARTRRLVVAHEAVVTAGFGAEVVARVVERLGPGVLRGVARVGQPRVPVPFSPPLEAATRPGAARVVAAVRRLLAA